MSETAVARPSRPILVTILAVLWLLGGLYAIYQNVTTISAPGAGTSGAIVFGLSAVVAVVQVIASIGLLMLKRWGYQLTIGVVIVGIILALIAYFTVDQSILTASLNQYAAQHPNLSPDALNTAASIAKGALLPGLIFGLIIDILILLYLFLNKKVKAAYQV